MNPAKCLPSHNFHHLNEHMWAKFAFAFNFVVASFAFQFLRQIFRDSSFKIREFIGEYLITQNDQWKSSDDIGLCAASANGLLGVAGIRLKQFVNHIRHIQVTLRSVKKIV